MTTGEELAKLAKVIPLVATAFKHATGQDLDLSAVQPQIDKLYQELALDLDQFVRWEFDYLNQRVSNLEEKCQEAAKDHQLHLLWRNFSWEAERETIDERKRMLTAALVGTFDPRLTIDQKARVERKLRELDPIDVRCLYGLARTAGRWDVGGDAKSETKSEAALVHAVWMRCPSADVLASSGSLRISSAGGGFGHGPWEEAMVTPLGRDILQVVNSYVTKKGAPFDIPGRHPELTAVEETEAWDNIRATAGLTEFLDFANRQKWSRIQYDMLPPGGPPSEGSPKLIFTAPMSELRENAAVAIERITSDSFSLKILGEKTSAYFNVVMRAPPNELRVLADYVEAVWWV